VNEKRFYQRYAINDGENAAIQPEVRIDGVLVRLVDFSLGGLCFLSAKPYSPKDIITLSVNFENRGQINLVGQVIRVNKAGKLSSVAIDLSHSYNLNTLHKL
jgi:hypothetical protein